MNKGIGLIILIIGIFLNGCGAGVFGESHDLGRYQYTRRESFGMGRTIEVMVDHNYGNADRVEIGKAIEQWNYVLNGQIKLEVIDWEYQWELDGGLRESKRLIGEGGFIIFMDYGEDAAVRAQASGDGLLGWVDHIPGHILHIVRDRMKNDDLKEIVMHEMGHLLGANHQGIDLMNKWYTPAHYQCIDLGTIKEISQVQGLNLKYLNYCWYY